MTYGSETWPMKVEDMHRLERAERMMVRHMCGGSLENRKSSEELRQRLEIDNVADVIRRNRWRWFGHVERKDDVDWVKACLLYTSDAADEEDSVDLGGSRIIKKKTKK